MNTERILQILDECTALVRLLSVPLGAELGADSPLRVRIMCDPRMMVTSELGSPRMISTSEAWARGMTLVTYPGIGVAVDEAVARKRKSSMTRLLGLPPAKQQRQRHAWEIVGMLDPQVFDLCAKLKLVSYGWLIAGWKVHESHGVPSGREAIWQLESAAHRAQYAPVLGILKPPTDPDPAKKP